MIVFKVILTAVVEVIEGEKVLLSGLNRTIIVAVDRGRLVAVVLVVLVAEAVLVVLVVRTVAAVRAIVVVVEVVVVVVVIFSVVVLLHCKDSLLSTII